MHQAAKRSCAFPRCSVPSPEPAQEQRLETRWRIPTGHGKSRDAGEVDRTHSKRPCPAHPPRGEASPPLQRHENGNWKNRHSHARQDSRQSWGTRLWRTDRSRRGQAPPSVMWSPSMHAPVHYVDGGSQLRGGTRDRRRQPCRFSGPRRAPGGALLQISRCCRSEQQCRTPWLH